MFHNNFHVYWRVNFIIYFSWRKGRIFPSTQLRDIMLTLFIFVISIFDDSSYSNLSLSPQAAMIIPQWPIDRLGSGTVSFFLAVWCSRSRQSRPIGLRLQIWILWLYHGTYIRWWLRNRCARKQQSLLFDLFRAYDYDRELAQIRYFFSEKTFRRAEHALIPSDIRTMDICHFFPNF